MDNNNQNIKIGNKKYAIHRATLKKWLELEDIRLGIKKATDSKDKHVSELIYTFLSVAFGIPDINWDTLTWIRVAEIYTKIITLNLPKYNFPILNIDSSDGGKVAWDYEGRTWYLWSHMVMSKYGWHLDYVANLDIDDALALIQEILIEEQTAKEWEWSLSEIAYPYNENSKSNKFVPLERPKWMRVEQKIEPVKKVKILRKHMPIGNIVRAVDAKSS